LFDSLLPDSFRNLAQLALQNLLRWGPLCVWRLSTNILTESRLLTEWFSLHDYHDRNGEFGKAAVILRADETVYYSRSPFRSDLHQLPLCNLSSKWWLDTDDCSDQLPEPGVWDAYSSHFQHTVIRIYGVLDGYGVLELRLVQQHDG
jgi:hypothetical protein